MKILAVFLAILAIVNATKPMLFSAVTMITSQDASSASHLVTIDPKTGAVGDIMETFYYAGPSGSSKGISAFDALNGVYYYVPAYFSVYNFVYRGNVKTNTLMSPLAFPVNLIYELTYDASQQRIIVAGATANRGDFLIAFPTDESQPWSVIAQIDTDYSFATGTLDSANQIYYWLSVKAVNATSTGVFLHSISLSNPSKIKTVQVMCSPSLAPQRIRYDAVHKQLYIFSYEFSGIEFVFYIEKVSPTGACSAVKIQLPDGLTTDWALDPITQNLYVSVEGDKGAYLYTLDITTGQVLNNVFVSGFVVPESLQFAYI